MSTWEPPRCVHGRILLACPDDACPTQQAYLDQQEFALADYERRQQAAVRRLVREALGLDPRQETP